MLFISPHGDIDDAGIEIDETKENNEQLNRYGRGYILINYDLCTFLYNYRETLLHHRLIHWTIKSIHIS